MTTPSRPKPLWAHDTSKWKPRNLDLEISALCNLHCKYCYLEKRTESDPPRGNMTRETADLVLQYIEHILACIKGERRHISVCLFGGEPFLNFDVMRYFVEECDRRQYPVGRAVMTNGATATPEQVRWCLQHRVVAKRSVGGCPEACALTRPGDYLDRYLAESLIWNDYHRPRRVTTIPETAKFLMQTVKFFYGKGYWGSLDFSTDDYAQWQPEQIAEYKSQTERLSREFVRQYRNGRVLGNEMLQVYGRKIYGTSKVMTIGCGAGHGLQAVTWDGYLLPCHRMLREPRTSVMCGGHLRDVLCGKPPRFGSELQDDIFRCSSGIVPKQCEGCEATQCCQHGCRHLAWATSGVLDKVPEVRCIFTRHWRRLALLVHSQLGNAQIGGKPWWEARPTRCLPIPEDA